MSGLDEIIAANDAAARMALKESYKGRNPRKHEQLQPKRKRGSKVLVLQGREVVVS
jgi:hypothetical protein